MVSMDSYAVPNPAVVGSIVEGEAVLILPEQGQVKVLNEVGARIWALADGTRTLRQIAAALCDEYEVDPVRAGADICTFAVELEKKEIISLSPHPFDKPLG